LKKILKQCFLVGSQGPANSYKAYAQDAYGVDKGLNPLSTGGLS